MYIRGHLSVQMYNVACKEHRPFNILSDMTFSYLQRLTGNYWSQ